MHKLHSSPPLQDLISRGWRGVSDDLSSSSASNGKRFVREVGLLIIDEIHLLGELFFSLSLSYIIELKSLTLVSISSQARNGGQYLRPLLAEHVSFLDLFKLKISSVDSHHLPRHRPEGNSRRL